MGSEGSSLLTDHLRKIQVDEGYKSSRMKQMKQLNKIFRYLDEDGNGTIEGHEIKELLSVMKKSSKNKLSQQELEDLLAMADQNHDKRIDFTEFISLIGCLGEKVQEA